MYDSIGRAPVEATGSFPLEAALVFTARVTFGVKATVETVTGFAGKGAIYVQSYF